MAIHEMGKKFSGFPKEGVQYLLDLKKNNTKVWFDAHREEFESYLMEPSRNLVVALGEQLQEMSPGVTADPRTNKSIFRINRDTRFSKDKSPYKTNLGIFWWEGSRPKMECPGFYFHLEPPELMLGAGLYMFPKDLLESYRRSVVHPRQGKTLKDTISQLMSNKGISLGGKHYKRVPSGYDPNQQNAEYLLYNGLHAGTTITIPKELYSSDLLNFCTRRFRLLLPLHRWLVELMNRS
ncbi:MAG: DUF2461 domain-containing protein [Spirochaetaceae bacterium]|nr:MAG: DUF2461 domain-containing protein [Spirochaetaceae bacterium]